jgi:hypothetical protein
MRKQLMRQMTKGQKPGGGGAAAGGSNAQAMQAQLQAAMQDQMAKMQDELASQQIEGTAGQGAVKVVVNGQREPLSVKIDKSVIDPEEPDLLEDLVLTAMKDALSKAHELEQDSAQRMAGGLLPPGMSLPGLF